MSQKINYLRHICQRLWRKKNGPIAINPNAILTIESYVPTDILCLIYAEPNYHTVQMIFHNLLDESQWFDYFFSNLQQCIQLVLHKYFIKMKEYYILEPTRNLNLIDRQVAPVVGTGELKFGATNIKRDKTCITYAIKDAQLRNLELYLQDKDATINLNVHRTAITKIWAKLSINFITDLLTKLFALTLNENTHKLQFPWNDFSRSFDAVGIFDVYRNRSQIRGFGQQKKSYPLTKFYTFIRKNGCF